MGKLNKINTGKPENVSACVYTPHMCTMCLRGRTCVRVQGRKFVGGCLVKLSKGVCAISAWIGCLEGIDCEFEKIALFFQMVMRIVKDTGVGYCLNAWKSLVQYFVV